MRNPTILPRLLLLLIKPGHSLEPLGTKDHQTETAIAKATTVVIVAVAILLLQARCGIATNVVVVEVVNVIVNGETESGIESLVAVSGPLGIMTDAVTKIEARTAAESVSYHSFDFHSPLPCCLSPQSLHFCSCWSLLPLPAGGPRSSDPKAPLLLPRSAPTHSFSNKRAYLPPPPTRVFL